MPLLREFRHQGIPVSVHSTKAEAGRAAALRAASLLHSTLDKDEWARIIVGTGNSQEELVDSLVAEASLDWSRIEVFHMDEYTGMPPDHPASFRRWLREHLTDRVTPGQVHFLAGDAADPEAECERYAALLDDRPVDICFLGFGENGHIAFNDPHVADFNDPKRVKRVQMDDLCRRQQVGEGHFPDLDSVPREALTLTCPALLSARNLICTVPEKRKAVAVRNAIEGPLTTQCPASSVFTHPSAWLFLDAESASLLHT